MLDAVREIGRFVDYVGEHRDELTPDIRQLNAANREKLPVARERIRRVNARYCSKWWSIHSFWTSCGTRRSFMCKHPKQILISIKADMHG